MVKNIVKFLTSIIVCNSAGAVGSLFTRSSLDTWYKSIQKPAFTPPAWVFAPAWITLYTLMGISAFLVWRKGFGDRQARGALMVFILQLALNSSWSIGFFGLRSPLTGLFIIIAMWLAILWTILRFRKISRFAAILLIPYILWVSFAVLLNLSIVILNL